MEFKHLIILALQVSVFATVLGFGLKATTEDVLYLVWRPGLLARSLLSIFLVMPAIAVVLAHAFAIRQPVAIALVALSISPLPPLIPNRLTRAGGKGPFAIALMATVAILSVAIVPLLVDLLGRYFERPFEVSRWTLAGIIAMSTLLPLAVGMAFRAMQPKLAVRIQAHVAFVGMVVLLLAALLLLVTSLPAIWALIGDGTIIAIAIFVAAGLAAGHLLGTPDPEEQTVLAFTSASRHPAIAFAIASANFPTDHFVATILLYLMLSASGGWLYTLQQRRRKAAPVT